MKKKSPKTMAGLRISPEFKRKLEDIANEKGCTFSDLCQNWLEVMANVFDPLAAELRGKLKAKDERDLFNAIALFAKLGISVNAISSKEENQFYEKVNALEIQYGQTGTHPHFLRHMLVTDYLAMWLAQDVVFKKLRIQQKPFIIDDYGRKLIGQELFNECYKRHVENFNQMLVAETGAGLNAAALAGVIAAQQAAAAKVTQPDEPQPQPAPDEVIA